MTTATASNLCSQQFIRHITHSTCSQTRNHSLTLTPTDGCIRTFLVYCLSMHCVFIRPKQNTKTCWLLAMIGEN